MNRRLLLICAATLPLFLFGVVYQAIQYQDLKHDVNTKTAAQYTWVEKNKKVFAGISVLSAPERIETLAQQDPGLVPVGADGTLKVTFGPAGASR